MKTEKVSAGERELRELRNSVNRCGNKKTTGRVICAIRVPRFP